MDIKWLEDFLSLAKTGNFSLSAQVRNVTQPAFSRRIKSLESWLGVELVDRTTYPTRLTTSGEVFLPTAQQVVMQLNDERVRLQGKLADPIDIVSFSAQHSLSLGFFPDWLRLLQSYLGPFQSRLAADNFHDCVQLLIEGRCQFLLCFSYPGVPYTLDEQRFPSLVLSNDRLVPIAKARTTGRNKYNLDSNPPQETPYLAYEPDSFLGRAVDLILERNPTVANMLKPYYVNSLAEGLKVMVLEGHGIAWVPESTITRELAGGQLRYAGDDSWSLPLSIRLYRSAAPQSALVETIWTYLTNEPLAVQSHA